MGIKMKVAIDSAGVEWEAEHYAKGKGKEPLHCAYCPVEVAHQIAHVRERDDKPILVPAYFRLRPNGRHEEGCRHAVSGTIRTIANESKDLIESIRSGHYRLRLVMVRDALRKTGKKTPRTGSEPGGRSDKTYQRSPSMLPAYINSARRVLKLRALCDADDEMEAHLQLIFEGNTIVPWSQFYFETERHLTVLQCTSAYPTAPDQIGLNVLSELRSRYGRHVGLSDHSGTIFAGLAAATLGVEMIEVHVTMSDSCFGPDVPASLTFDALSDLCVGVEFIHTAVNSPITKTEIGSDGAGMRALFTRSLVTTRIIKAGEILDESDVTVKKPGSGIPYESLDRVIGSTARTDLEANHMLTFDDLNEVSG